MRKHFRRRFEAYYQSVAVYALALITYAVIRGTFSGSEFRVVFKDPVVYVFVIVLGYSVIDLVFNVLYQRDIIISDDAVIFQNRFESRAVKFSEINWIHAGRARKVKVRGSYGVIKIMINSHMRAIRINPVHFHGEREMMEAFKALSEKVNKDVQVS